MSLKRREIYTLATQLNQTIAGAEFLSFEETEPFHWILKLSSYDLYICLKNPFLRFHLSRKNLKSTQTSFTCRISSFLSHSKVERVDWVNQDRILMIALKRKREAYFLIIEFFPKRPNLFLLDEGHKILLSLHPTQFQTYSPPDNPKFHEECSIDPAVDDKSIESRYERLEAESIFHHKKKELHHHLAMLFKKSKTALERSEVELSKCLEWNRVYHEGVLLQSNLYRIKRGMLEISLEDWEDGTTKTIPLNPKHSLQEEVTRRFKQSKKLKAGIAFAEKSIEKAKSQIGLYENLLRILETLKTERELIVFAEAEAISIVKQSIEKKAKLPYHEFTSESGLLIWVGKSARENDLLTFRYAKGSDYWMHVNDFPGSHVVLRVEKKQQPDPESIKDAIQLAIGYSKAKDQGSADVCITQRKFVARLGKGKPGKVQVSKHTSVYTSFDLERFKRIKERRKESHGLLSSSTARLL